MRDKGLSLVDPSSVIPHPSSLIPHPSSFSHGHTTRVLGGGPGGYAAAFLAADLGMQVTLVDLESRLGGTCLLRGCIPSKALLHVAKAMAEATHLAEWGVSFPKPAIDLAAMRARKEKVIATLTGGLKQIAAKRNVNVDPGQGPFRGLADAAAAAASATPRWPTTGSRFENCIVASGSRPYADSGLRPAHAAGDGLHRRAGTARRARVAAGGRRRLHRPGNGDGLCRPGHAASSVVELTDGLLPGADRDLVRPLHKKLSKDFADNLCWARRSSPWSTRARRSKSPSRATSTARSSSSAACWFRVGRRPNSDGLGLEKTKVQIDKQGFIAVDPQRRTAEPHILGHRRRGRPADAGPQGDPRGQDGRRGHRRPARSAFEPRAIPAVVFTDPEIAWAGLTETEAKRQGRTVEVAQFPWAASGRAQSVGRTEGLTKWLIDPASAARLGLRHRRRRRRRPDRRGRAGHRDGRLPSADVTETIHPHPTLSETLGFAAEVFFGTATDLYRPRKR